MERGDKWQRQLEISSSSSSLRGQKMLRCRLISCRLAPHPPPPLSCKTKQGGMEYRSPHWSLHPLRRPLW